MKNTVSSSPLRKYNGLRISAAAVFLFLASTLHCWAQVATGGAQNLPREISRVAFAAAGDVIPHQAVVEAAAAADQAEKSLQQGSSGATKDNALPTNDHGGWDSLFSQVADVFRQADFGFVNLETPVAPTHSQGTHAFQFNAPIDLVQALKANGIKIVSFANNHVFDQGNAGFAETLDHLREQGMLFTGAGSTAEAAWKPVILEKNGSVGWG